MPGGIGNVPNLTKILFDLIRFFRPFMLIQIVLSIFTLLAAVQFMKLVPWGRTSLEILSWLYLTLGMAVLALWIRSAHSSLSHIPSLEDLPDFKGLLQAAGIAIAALIAVAWIFPMGIILYFLKSQRIKSLFHTPIPL